MAVLRHRSGRHATPVAASVLAGQGGVVIMDRFSEQPEELAAFYAEGMADGLGPATERHIEWKIRDARVSGDRRRLHFWERVKGEAQRRQARS